MGADEPIREGQEQRTHCNNQHPSHHTNIEIIEISKVEFCVSLAASVSLKLVLCLFFSL